MNTTPREIKPFAANLNPKTGLLLFITTLVLFVICAGAPAAGGGIGT